MKRVIITGGTSDIGKAIADRFLKEKWAVITMSRSFAKTSTKGRLTQLQYDLSDIEGLEPLVKGLRKTHGPIDAVVNCAAAWYRCGLLETSIQQWEQTFRVNVTASFRLSQAVVNHGGMKRGGSIIHIGSTNGATGEAGWAAYDASKAALAGMTRTMAIEMAERGILVNNVCPGMVATKANAGLLKTPRLMKYWNNRIPLGRFATIEEIAGVVYFLTTKDAAYISGQSIMVDGGQTACGDRSFFSKGD